MQRREKHRIPVPTHWSKSIVFSILVFIVLASPGDALAAKLESATIQAWDRYYAWVDARIQQQINNPGRFLIRDNLSPSERAEVEKELRAGEIVVKRVTGGVIPPGEKFNVPNGMIHHVWGSVLLPKVKMPELLRFLQDYDHHAGKFTDVERSKLVSRMGDNFKIFYRLSRSKAFFTVHYNSEQDVTYRTLDPKRVFSKSIATKIAELEDVGTPQEKERPVGEDSGFLWRLASWWRLQETDLGVIIECESASLSRGIPTAVTWIPFLNSYIRNTPVESLHSVMASIEANFNASK